MPTFTIQSTLNSLSEYASQVAAERVPIASLLNHAARDENIMSIDELLNLALENDPHVKSYNFFHNV